MGYFEILTITSFVFTLIQIAIPTKWLTSGISRALVIFVLIGLALTSGYYFSQLKHTVDIARKANNLLANKDLNYTSDGFIQASLSFLESNKDIYPDSYQRALKICEEYDCLGVQKDLVENVNQISASSKLGGILKGIAALNN